MSATDLVRVMLAPFREFTMLAPLLMFWTLIALGIWGGVLGIFLLFGAAAYYATSAWGSAGNHELAEVLKRA